MDGSGDDADDQRDDEDEGDEPPEPPPEPEDPSDDSPRITRQELEAFLVLPWMSGAVAGDETARETFEILEEWMDATEDEDDEAKKKATLRVLAKKRALTEDAFYKRYERLKVKYLPRYKRWRNGMIILILLGATLLIVALSRVLPHKPIPPGDIRPEPSTHPVAPVPSVPVKIDPKDTEFMPAQPTQPGPKVPPRLKP